MPGLPMLPGHLPRPFVQRIYSSPVAAFGFISSSPSSCLMSGGIYGGAISQVMGKYSFEIREKTCCMIIMFNVVGVAMPFPFLFKMKFHLPTASFC